MPYRQRERYISFRRDPYYPRKEVHMTRVKKIVRFVAVLTALSTVAGAQFPLDEVMAFIGGVRCC